MRKVLKVAGRTLPTLARGEFLARTAKFQLIISLLGAAAAHAQPNMVLLVSPAGEFIGQGQTYYTNNPGDIAISGTSAAVTMTALGFTSTLAGPGGAPLAVGQYSNVVQYPFNGSAPGLNVSGLGRNCTNVCGSFQVLELQTNDAGQIAHFWATFSQDSNCTKPPLMGELRYNSLLAPNRPLPRTLQVPEDFPTIQSAVDDASALVVDTVLVDPGLYRESVHFNGKLARLLSQNGPARTLIMAPVGASAVTFDGGETTAASLIGFTLTNSAGGVSIANNSSPTILSNVIVNCQTGIGVGGGPTIRSNEITGCGVGIYLVGAMTPIIEHNIIQGNTSHGISLFGGFALIRNNTIRGNHGDGVTMLNGSEPSIVQNLIFDNGGRGIAATVPLNSRGPLIVNNTIERNGGPGGAGILLDGFYEASRIMNNIVTGDQTLNVSGYGGSVFPVVWCNDFFPSNAVSYAGTMTNLAGIQGNISQFPWFTCLPSDDFHLLARSACIDAGTNGADQLPATDFEGNPRIVAGTPGGPSLVDMGAFEFDPSRPPVPCLYLYCPSNMAAIAPPGQNSVVVNYPPPDAAPVATVTTSPVSGSLFPEGDDPVAVSAVYETNVLNCSFTISVFTTTNFGRALNLTNLPWVSFGDAPWFVQMAVTHPGPVAPQSGAITNNQTSTLQTTLSGPGTLSFWWKVSSQLNHDLLYVSANGSTQAVISGQVDWQPRTLYLGSGPQVVEWTYAKDASGSSGQDAGWLDEVSWTPGAVAPFITSQPASLAVGSGMSAMFSVTASGTPPFSYQWLFNGQALPGATGSTLAVTNVQAWNTGSYSVVVMNQVGTNYSSTATLKLAEVLAWGVNIYGQTNVPAALTNVAAIAGGWNHSMVLSRDGTVTVWGSNNRGQTNVPAGLSNVVAIASRSGDLCMALRPNRTVAVWGDNSYGATNVPVGLSNVVAISAGGYGCLALKSDGTAVGWGNLTVPAGLSNLVAVSAGDSASLFLRADGTVAATGTTVPPYVTNIVRIAAGGTHNLALRADGTVVGWGDNSFGQISIPTNLTQVVAIAAGDYHSMALRADHTVVVWGRYYTGGYGGNGGFIVPAVPPTLTNVQAIAAGSDHDLALITNALPVPFITAQPLSQTVVVGSNATFSVTAGPTGSGLSYQWLFNSSNSIPYATNAILVLSNVQPASAGLYSVQVTNPFGSTLSSNATLLVDHPPVADASATPSTVICTNGADATVILDGSRSSDPDGDVLQYTWLSLGPPSPILLTNGVVAIVVLPLGVHPLALVVSDGLVASTNVIAVTVFTPSQAVAQLSSRVSQSVSNSSPLIAILQSAQAALSRGDSVAAVNQLLAFQKMVRVQVAPSAPALAEQLISAAQQIIDSLQGRRGMRPTNLRTLNQQAGGNLQLRFSGTTGQIYIVEASTNLLEWAMIGIASQQDDGEFHFEDANAARLPNRFYRVLKP